MNKEEIDNLENYLKNDLPKIETTIPITNFGSVDLDDLMDTIKRLKKVPTIDELLKENKKLQHQLEEKDKVIDDTLNFIKEKIYQIVDDYYDYYEKGACFVDEDLDKLLEILERGKNEK